MFSLKRRPMKFMNFWNVSNQQFMVWLPIIYGFLDKSLLICSFWHGNESLVFMPKKVTVKKTCLKKDLSSLEHMNKLCNIIWFCKSRPETSIFQIFTSDKTSNSSIHPSSSYFLPENFCVTRKNMYRWIELKAVLFCFDVSTSYFSTKVMDF